MLSKQKRMALCLLLVCAGLAQAESADREKPIQVEADHAAVDDRNGINEFTGNVLVVQGTLRLQADRVLVREDKQGNQTADAIGKPIRMKQKLDDNAGWVEGEADKMLYDSKNGQLRLMGKAWLKRGRDEVRGEFIFFDSVTEQYQAKNMVPGEGKPVGAGGRVVVTLQPKKPAAKPSAEVAKP